MKPVRHLFWDFDGTLYDSYPNVTHAFLCTLDELGCSALVTPREALSLLKVSVFSAAQHCAGMAGLDVARVMEVFARYHARESGFAPYAGLGECLRTLHAAGVRHVDGGRDVLCEEQLLYRDGVRLVLPYYFCHLVVNHRKSDRKALRGRRGDCAVGDRLFTVSAAVQHAVAHDGKTGVDSQYSQKFCSEKVDYFFFPIYNSGKKKFCQFDLTPRR